MFRTKLCVGGGGREGSLSPLPSCLYMKYFEQCLLSSFPLYTHINVGYRYVDILEDVPFSSRTFFHCNNNLSPTIRFTIEQENGTITFLEVTKEHQNNQIVKQNLSKTHQFSNLYTCFFKSSLLR